MATTLRLADQSNGRPISHELTLTSWILFSVTETLQRNYNQTADILGSGASRPERPAPNHEVCQSIHSHVLSMSGRCLQQPFAFNDVAPSAKNVQYSNFGPFQFEFDSFETLSDVEQSFNTLMNQAIIMLSRNTAQPHHFTYWTMMVGNFRQYLSKWYQTFTTFLQQHVSLENDAEAYRTILLLKIRHQFGIVFIETLPFRDEMMFDIFEQNFETALAFAYDVIQLDTSEAGHNHDHSLPGPSSGHHRPSLGFDILLVPILLYVAVHCRHPTLRRCAIKLLYACDHWEGIWDGYHAAVIATRIMELEEKDNLPLSSSDLPFEDRIKLCTWRFPSSISASKIPDLRTFLRNRFAQPGSEENPEEEEVKCRPAEIEICFLRSPWPSSGPYEVEVIPSNDNDRPHPLMKEQGICSRNWNLRAKKLSHTTS